MLFSYQLGWLLLALRIYDSGFLHLLFARIRSSICVESYSHLIPLISLVLSVKFSFL
uniref:Uncharacterized protein n=1 Tax=Utricularia reniformis TaxID=192314 RepID=A0A1Y0AZQ0_9LAMI|nr:hypothetical protein AEK19_MT0365 [Utricularia reniformis]ART30637.1 hypothetical protein AEK19_MT0365 [Utricularia reniformis]